MKKIFWTTVFWLVIFFGFAFYMKMFDANMATNVTARLGAASGTTIQTDMTGVLGTGAQDPVMSGLNAIQTTLTDMQTKLDTLVSSANIPTVSQAAATTTSSTAGLSTGTTTK